MGLFSFSDDMITEEAVVFELRDVEIAISRYWCHGITSQLSIRRKRSLHILFDQLEVHLDSSLNEL